MTRTPVPVIALALVTAAGCSTVEERSAERDQRLEAAMTVEEPPAESRPEADDRPDEPEVVLPPLSPAGEPEPRFNIAVEEVPARDFFHGLVEDTPYNIIVHPDVTGTLSLNLEDVTVPGTLEAVREVYGYEFEESPVGFTVRPPGEDARIFHLNYLNITRTGSSSTRVSSGRSEGSESEGDEEEGGSASGNRVSTESTSDLWAEVEAAVDNLIAADEDASATFSPQSGTVVVRAHSRVLREVEAFFQRLRNSLNRQVILEARILEVELSKGQQTGVNWSAVGSSSGREFQVGQTDGSGLEGETVTLGDVAQGTLETTGLGGMFAAGFQAGDFSAFIEALSTQGDVQVLSSPRVSTVNNQKAIIKVGTDSFYVTDFSTERDTTTGTTASNTRISDIELSPFFSGIALDVTPSIDAEGTITLHVQPSVSEVSGEVRSFSLGQDQEISIPIARSSTRRSDSIVRARDGEMVVIGGLIQDREEDTTSRVPVLGSLPLIGGLFRHQETTTTKSELVILIQPHVVGADTWRDSLEDFSGAAGELRER
ncbi:MSHA biogenesis protein MshL [Thiohalospira halophila DSM 15071]|uniref:MSHA biogenesis protein MshL n=1 Tax=Thiohalospira halophila DSM 15071 TaxID=1123397 RepID=A0A1I1N7N5_9GAMM|nr:pilus (MSHA type) biogenesis protein MshL [Thiohalospira halophila]SFC93627.1 MSHA biogenesis protein MshL [Thiohalospira halophila DSM 15071]